MQQWDKLAAGGLAFKPPADEARHFTLEAGVLPCRGGQARIRADISGIDERQRVDLLSVAQHLEVHVRSR